MVSRFAAADALSSAAVSLVYGEELEFIPWKKGQYADPGGPDPERAAVVFKGTYGGAIGDQNIGGDRRGSDFRGTVTTKDRVITADNRDWPAGAQQGDRIKALEQPGQPVSEIVSINADGVNRVIVQMVST